MGYMTQKELKNMARDKMLGQYGTAIGAFLFMRFVLMIALGASSSLFANHGIMFMIASFIIVLFEGIFAYGELSIYLKISVGMPTDMTDVVSAFKGSADKAIKSRLILMMILYGCMYSQMGTKYICDRFINETGSIITKISGILLAILCVWLLLTYSQVMYFLHDFSEITVKEACIRSRRLMQGNKLTLLSMYIGFIPIYIVGVLSWMVGLYFLHPYVKMTLTEFYLDRVKKSEKKDGANI